MNEHADIPVLHTGLKGKRCYRSKSDNCFVDRTKERTKRGRKQTATYIIKVRLPILKLHN